MSLERAARTDATLLANLFELYAHDLSECFDIEPGPDGRFGYAKLPLYWSEPERRFPFLIKSDGRILGFVLATLGCSPISDDPDIHDVAEFFVLRRYRRSAIGRRAAHLLWDRFPGRWMVRVATGNPGALAFWERTIADYLHAAPAASQHVDGNGTRWMVFAFAAPQFVSS